MRKMLGRAPRPEERDLLDEVQRRKDAAEAIKFLSEHRTPGLMRQIEKRSFPTQSLAKRFAIVLAGPAANIAAGAGLAYDCFYVRCAPVPPRGG